MYIHCSLWKYSLFKEAAMKNKGKISDIFG